MIADRQTHVYDTHIQRDTLIAIHRSPIGGGVISERYAATTSMPNINADTNPKHSHKPQLSPLLRRHCAARNPGDKHTANYVTFKTVSDLLRFVRL